MVFKLNLKDGLFIDFLSTTMEISVDEIGDDKGPQGSTGTRSIKAVSVSHLRDRCADRQKHIFSWRGDLFARKAEDVDSRTLRSELHEKRETAR